MIVCILNLIFLIIRLIVFVTIGPLDLFLSHFCRCFVLQWIDIRGKYSEPSSILLIEDNVLLYNQFDRLSFSSHSCFALILSSCSHQLFYQFDSYCIRTRFCLIELYVGSEAESSRFRALPQRYHHLVTDDQCFTLCAVNIYSRIM